MCYANMWLICYYVLCVTLVGDCIICLNPKIWQNSKYFLVPDEIFFVSFIMFLFFSVNIEYFLDMSIFRSLSIYHSSFNIFSAFKLSDHIFKYEYLNLEVSLYFQQQYNFPEFICHHRRSYVNDAILSILYKDRHSQASADKI